MKKAIVLSLALLVMVTMAGAGFSMEEEDDDVIVRHEQWLEQVLISSSSAQLSVSSFDAATLQTTLLSGSGDGTLTVASVKNDSAFAGFTGLIGGTIAVSTALPTVSTVQPAPATMALPTSGAQVMIGTITIPAGSLATLTPLAPITPPDAGMTIPQDQGATLTVTTTVSKPALASTPQPAARTRAVPSRIQPAAKTELDQVLAVKGRIAENNTRRASFTVVSTIAPSVKAGPVYMGREKAAK